MKKPLYILGINAYHGDAAAALIRDGQLVAAAEEERFNRIKHCAGFPTEAIRYCLKEAGIGPSEIDHVGISRNSSVRLYKKILFALTQGHKMVGELKGRLERVARIGNLEQTLARALGIQRNELKAQFHRVEHHKAHMASTFFVSPFQEAAVLSIDGFGDFCSTMLGVGRGNRIEVLNQVEYPHSLGLFYAMVTQFIGFPKYGDEGKVMGLAPFGKLGELERVRQIVCPDGNGLFRLNLDFFQHHTKGVDMTWEKGTPQIGQIWSDRMVREFGPPRLPHTPIGKREEDLAAALQIVLEENIMRLLTGLAQRTKLANLALAGGVAFNSVANGLIQERTPFRELYVQAAAGDGGTSLGAAFYIYHQILGYPRSFVMEHAYTGPCFSDEEIRSALQQYGLQASSLSDEALFQETAQHIAEGKVVGWFQDRMEFGPRALGNRSIVADPRRVEMKDILNSRIKHRESFRPFAPSILEENVGEYFEKDYPSPFMLLVYNVRPEKRGVIPAVTHVDGTGRLQTVSLKTNPRYWGLIDAFYRLTGVPVVLNTSFNENEPIVCAPRDAIDCFLKTNMDVLAIGNFLVERSRQTNPTGGSYFQPEADSSSTRIGGRSPKF